MERRWRVLAALIILPLAGALLPLAPPPTRDVALAAPARWQAGGPLVARFLDVGREGEAAWLTTPDGGTILIDCGPASYGSTLVARLREAGVGRIDVLAPSHAHADHVGGCYHVLRAFPVGDVLWIGQEDSSFTWRRVWDEIQAAQSVGTHITQIFAGLVFHWGGGVQATVYNPPPHPPPYDEDEDSHVLLVEHGAIRLLFAGDIRRRGEIAALGAGLVGKVDVLKVSHHGSRTASSRQFLAVVAPSVAIVGAGVNNPWRHPDAETVDRLLEAGEEVYVTAQCGDITVTSYGGSFDVATELDAPDCPYWSG